MIVSKGMVIGISRITTQDDFIDLECSIREIKNNIALVYVHNGDWYGLLNLETMVMEIQVPQKLRYNKEDDTFNPNPTIDCKFIGLWSYKDGRCTLCGAKEETHETDHLCRMHRYKMSYINSNCVVCSGKKTGFTDYNMNVTDDWDSDIPF